MDKDIIEQIHRDMLLRLSNEFDKSTGSFAYDILKPPSYEFVDIHGRIKDVDDKRSVFNLNGDELDDFIRQFTPIKRKKATTANIGLVLITGKPGQKVEEGILVASASHQYVITDGGALDNDGRGEFEVECTIEGKDGNADIGFINHFPVTVSGLETVTNITPITGGYDEEDDGSLRNRYFNYIDKPATSGNIYHYLLWAGNIEGVGATRVYPLWDGKNTVKLVLVDSNGQPASKELVNEVQEYIDPKGEKLEDGTWSKWGCGYGEAPIGAFCSVEPAIPVSVSVEASVQVAPGADIAALEEEFRQELIERFLLIALDYDVNVISLAKVSNIILNIDGIVDLDITSVKINGKSENLTLEDKEVPVFDEVTFNEL